MIWTYARQRLAEQARAVAFIVLYLVLFQLVVLQTVPKGAGRVAGGLGMVVVGLAFFLEGLFLGLMPLGERVGQQLPQRTTLPVILGFGLLLGVGATLAEPAIAALQTGGLTVTPWDAPLLYRLLETEPENLVIAVGAGVGVAVAAGMLRTWFGWSLKTLLFPTVGLVLGLSIFCTRDENLATIINLAWDTGGVTTGPVTVPLVLSLGIGVSRSMGHRQGTAEGFGIIALASLFPVLSVLLFAIALNHSTPRPASEAEFFAPANREAARRLVPTDEKLARLAFQRGSETARRALFPEATQHAAAIASLTMPAVRQALLGPLALEDWLLQRASPAEQALFKEALARQPDGLAHPAPALGGVVLSAAGMAVRAVVPLVALLLVVLVVILRDRPRRPDEVLLGIAFSWVGMTVLTSGIALGLGPLGDQVGRPLPRVFRSVPQEEGRLLLQPFDPAAVFPVYGRDGRAHPHFFLQNRAGEPVPVPFDPARFDPATGRYEHIVKRPPLFGPGLSLLGVALVFLFAFGMGYGSTMAEPALSALGRSVEELTVGTIKRGGVIQAVSLGVGLGLTVGVARILYHLPTVWLLVPAYGLLLVLTWLSEEDLTGFAWDAGGVTTGPVTVPLVLAMGLGIGNGLEVVDGFGIVAMASVFPIITMLLYGLLIRARQRQSVPGQAAGEAGHAG